MLIPSVGGCEPPCAQRPGHCLTFRLLSGEAVLASSSRGGGHGREQVGKKGFRGCFCIWPPFLAILILLSPAQKSGPRGEHSPGTLALQLPSWFEP